MNIFEDVDHFSDVKNLGFLCEFGDIVLDKVDKVTPLAILEHKVETLFILK